MCVVGRGEFGDMNGLLVRVEGAQDSPRVDVEDLCGVQMSISNFTSYCIKSHNA